jgi:FdhD protein
VEARVRKVRGDRIVEETDTLASEEPMEIRLVPEAGTAQGLAVTMRTPGNDFELAAGFLFTEGVIRGREDIERMVYCTDPGKVQEYNIVSVHLRPGLDFRPELVQRHFYTTSSCGVCGKTSIEAIKVRGHITIPKDRPLVTPAVLRRLPDGLRKGQRIFSRTGGLHAAGLFDAKGQLQALKEDVGRHNGVDKLIGHQLLADRLPLHDFILMVSGRASFEILQKAAVAGIPFVVAVGAPSSLAVDLAKEFGLTLIGFAHGEGYNVYAGHHRILDLQT